MRHVYLKLDTCLSIIGTFIIGNLVSSKYFGIKTNFDIYKNSTPSKFYRTDIRSSLPVTGVPSDCFSVKYLFCLDIFFAGIFTE